MTSPADAQSQAAGAAEALRSVGIDIDFAPVVDTPGSAENFLGSRAFSHSPHLERADGAGLRRRPADERDRGDREALPRSRPRRQATPTTAGSRSRPPPGRSSQGLLPFQSAVKAGTKLVMISTAIYPQLDGSQKPAAFSSTIINGMLRKKLGFTGVTVTDSLTAPAAERIPHAATKAMLAGSDLLIFGAESASELGYSTLLADEAGSLATPEPARPGAARIRALKEWLAVHGGATCTP